MNHTQKLIHEAEEATGMHSHGYRQYSSSIDGVSCEIITNGNGFSRTFFWHHSARITRDAAEQLLVDAAVKQTRINIEHEADMAEPGWDRR